MFLEIGFNSYRHRKKLHSTQPVITAQLGQSHNHVICLCEHFEEEEKLCLTVELNGDAQNSS